MWTRFFDMCSGGKLKNKYEVIYVEANIEEAVTLFSSRFSYPYNVTCNHCGEDYSVSEFSSLEEYAELDKKRSSLICSLDFFR